MEKAFSVASWNVKHFGTQSNNKPQEKSIKQRVEFLREQDADIVAVYEVRSSIIFQPLMEAMPDYQFHITEGPQAQEILVGIKNDFSGFVTQKLEFKSTQPSLRPGVLVTLRVDGQYYPILFLHLKSNTDSKDFGLRDDMLCRALGFRKHLDKAAGGKGRANYLFVGDLNTMGMNYPYSDRDISAQTEITTLKRRARHSSKQMRVLKKSYPHTWRGSSKSKFPPGNLDHVVAADHLEFRKFRCAEAECAEVEVRGWPQQEEDDQESWVTTYSDHALLYFEVQKVGQ